MSEKTLARISLLVAIGGFLAAISDDAGKPLAAFVGAIFALAILAIIIIPLLWEPIAGWAFYYAPLSYIVLATIFVSSASLLSHPFAFARGVAAITHLFVGSKILD